MSAAEREKMGLRMALSVGELPRDHYQVRWRAACIVLCEGGYDLILHTVSARILAY